MTQTKRQQNKTKTHKKQKRQQKQTKNQKIILKETNIYIFKN